MMPLAMANVGDVNIIRKITGRDEVRQRLAEQLLIAERIAYRLF